MLTYVGTFLETLTEHVNSRLREIFEWCNCIKLSLNPAKTEFIIVTNEIIVNRPYFSIGTNPIKEVNSFKYLGIYVDTRFKLNFQINHLKGKLSQPCGVSFRQSKFLDFQSVQNMYNSCIYSVLFYCIGVWHGVS